MQAGTVTNGKYVSMRRLTVRRNQEIVLWREQQEEVWVLQRQQNRSQGICMHGVRVAPVGLHGEKQGHRCGPLLLAMLCHDRITRARMVLDGCKMIVCAIPVASALSHAM